MRLCIGESSVPYHTMDPGINQKLDRLLTNLEEQKKIIIDNEREIKKEVSVIKTELNELKKSMKDNHSYYKSK